MNNVSLKKVLVLSLALLSFSLNANTISNMDSLAQQCQDLSKTVAALVSSQAKRTCIEKLNTASVFLEKAGYLILEYANATAKKELNHAIYSLQYAELNSCNRYIQIAHTKFEAQKIKNAL
ncbi:hypothetical protein [Legionella fallonii]|uniref:hypothetical protein n=1 Tax=Legionella fallonii TaxID=96230 RepID=UPI0005D406C1|nr:hypothetical protein [Legionella fallonii]